MGKKLLIAICSFFLLAGTMTSLALAEDRVQAKLGVEVKSGESSSWARSKDRVRVGDLLRIHVVPLSGAYVYVVHTNFETAMLLTEQWVPANSRLELPDGGSYQVDGASSKERLIILCSPEKLTEVKEAFVSEEIPYSQWKSIEQDLNQKSKISLHEQVEKPVSMAGNVRGAPKGQKRLKVYSGKFLLLKSFEFNVKK